MDAESRDVDVDTGVRMVADGSFLLDVRTDEEWTAGHAPDAHHVPLADLGARVAELPTDRSMVVICRSGARSGKAADALIGAGYEVVNLAGGMQAWVAAGHPCACDDGSPGVVA